MPTDSKRRVIVPSLSSAARIPFPGATSASAVACNVASTAPPFGRDAIHSALLGTEMPSLSSLLLFALGSLLITIVPGPDMALVTRQVFAYGQRVAFTPPTC